MIRHSAVESDVFYAVGSTIVTIKLIADNTNVSWRTWINVFNTCKIPTDRLSLSISGSYLLALQDGVQYKGALCSFREEYDAESGSCTHLDQGNYGHDGVIYPCEEGITLVKAWD